MNESKNAKSSRWRKKAIVKKNYDSGCFLRFARTSLQHDQTTRTNNTPQSRQFFTIFWNMTITSTVEPGQTQSNKTFKKEFSSKQSWPSMIRRISSHDVHFADSAGRTTPSHWPIGIGRGIIIIDSARPRQHCIHKWCDRRSGSDWNQQHVMVGSCVDERARVRNSKRTA